MELTKFDIDIHDINKVSELIYETDAETFDFYFKDKEKAARKISKLVKNGNNTLGFENIYIVTEGNGKRVLGILVASKGEGNGIINELKIFFKVLTPSDALRFVLFTIIDSLILAKLENNDFYLASVAVDNEFRGKGIGNFILEESLKLAKNNMCERVVLDVDFKNPGALRFYKRFGFKIFNKKSIPWFGGKKGVFNMEYSIIK
ncbi:GNAT family N-acetyltransferase [Methanobacterium sp. ACI-7]|uniref:GNAT family N-acetyltransferase n=1 Tax=unclassified Methanobacterium TaxID=2627676 RepID=UPI0039C4C6E2